MDFHEQQDTDVALLKANYSDWWSYHYNTIFLALDFKGFDKSNKEINKLQFLETLETGNYITFKLKTDADTLHYQLVPLDQNSDKNIKSVIKNTTAVILRHYKMEGETFPEFDLTDLDGKRFTNKNTEGKRKLFKTWFIHCTACIAEFPELNEFVENNENKFDFISLALDEPQELKKFLSKKPFSYSVIPNQTDFIEKEIGTYIYPTHIVVDKNGIIEKVFNDADIMIAYLKGTPVKRESKNEIAPSVIKKQENNLPPPPPPPAPARGLSKTSN